MARQGQIGRLLWYLWLVLILVGIGTWGGLAIYYAGPGSVTLRQWLVGGYLVGLILCLLLSRSMGWGVLTAMVLFSGLLVWWLTITPTNDKKWQPDVAQLPSATLQGNILTIHNVRNFTYRSENDYTPQWETRQYDISTLRNLDLFISYWGSPYIAHTILSWSFADGKHLAISVETRKSQGQVYSAVQGFFKQYNLIYVVADERDLVGLRSNYRHEKLYYYRLRNVSPDDARSLLREYVKRINNLTDSPQFYNALTKNCTTTILLNIKALDPNRIPNDWRLLVNGYLDKFLYAHHFIRTDLPFGQLRQQSRIDQRLRHYNGANFSGYLRQE